MIKYSIFFGLLYFVQGGIQAYTSNFQKPYLDQAGVDLDRIALLTSLMLLPFSIKILFGLLSDRLPIWGNHRKSYMILGLFLAALCYLGAAGIEPKGQYWIFASLIFFAACGMALFDTSVDGLALDISRKSEQGSIQSAMQAGRSSGYILLSLLFGFLASRLGYSIVFIIMTGLVLIPLLAILNSKYFFPVSKIEVEPNHSQAQQLKFLGRPSKSLLFFGLYAFLYSVTSFGIDGLMTLFAQKELGFQIHQLGTMGSLQGVGAILGALISGFCVFRLGAQKTAYIALVGISVGGLMMSQSSGSSDFPEVIFGMTLLWGIFWSFQETIFVTLAMYNCGKTHAATLFASLMMVSNLGNAFGEGLATSLVADFGFRQVFQFLALGMLLILPLLRFYFLASRSVPYLSDIQKSEVHL